MPVTQRFVHGGLCLVAGLLTLCVVVLALGASRNTVNNAGLPGSLAPTFGLRDSAGNWCSLKDSADKITLVLLAPASAHGSSLQPRQLKQLNDIYKVDAEVAMVAIQFTNEDAAQPAPGEVARQSSPISDVCPDLKVLTDVDRSVANAFRIVDQQPTFFVIDSAGVIRGRIPLSDSAAIAVTETITSLKAPASPQQPLAPHAS